MQRCDEARLLCQKSAISGSLELWMQRESSSDWDGSFSTEVLALERFWIQSIFSTSSALTTDKGAGGEQKPFARELQPLPSLFCSFTLSFELEHCQRLETSALTKSGKKTSDRG